jgi:hypothetical protein
VSIRSDPVWWEPSVGRLQYLRRETELLPSDYPNDPAAPLCLGCSREIQILKGRYDTGLPASVGTDDPNQNELTEFLDELDIEAFRDSGNV